MVLRRPSARSREGLNDGHRRTSAGEQFVMSDRERLPDRRGAKLGAGPLGAALALIDAYQVPHKDSQQTGAD